MKAREFEQTFYEREGIVIVLRCDPGREVGEYNYQRAAPGSMTLTELRNGRLSSLEVACVVHDGDAQEPHGRTMLSSIRDSYRR